MPASREEYDEIVESLGKFEGQAAYVPYFWEQGLEGFADYEEFDPNRWGFKVRATDVALFPELLVNTVVWLRETDQGFVEEV